MHWLNVFFFSAVPEEELQLLYQKHPIYHNGLCFFGKIILFLKKDARLWPSYIKFHKFDVIPFNSRSNEHQYNHDIRDLNCNVFNDVELWK